MTVNDIFHRGDANNDGKLNIADAINGLDFLFQGTSIPCKEALDANDDGQVNITDPVFVLSYLFRGGAAPAPPGPPPQACGADPEPSVHLSCDTFTSC